MAQSGHRLLHRTCLLSGAKQHGFESSSDASLKWDGTDEGDVTVKRRDIPLFVFCAAIVLAVTAANSLRLSAQDQPGFAGNMVTPLVKVDLTRVSNKQVIANIYEVPPGHMVPLHFHHGDEFHLVLSGEWAAQVEGRSDHVMKAGDAQYVEREHLHGGNVISAAPLRLLGVMIVDKDKPIIEMKH
jgi:quercetin dioxygenase-like cupin family protein